MQLSECRDYNPEDEKFQYCPRCGKEFPIRGTYACFCHDPNRPILISSNTNQKLEQ